MKRITINIPTLSDIKALKDKLQDKVQDIRIEHAAIQNFKRLLKAEKKVK